MKHGTAEAIVADAVRPSQWTETKPTQNNVSTCTELKSVKTLKQTIKKLYHFLLYNHSIFSTCVYVVRAYGYS